jgi:hypothetical protein
MGLGCLYRVEHRDQLVALRDWGLIRLRVEFGFGFDFGEKVSHLRLDDGALGEWDKGRVTLMHDGSCTTLRGGCHVFDHG